MRKDLVLLLSLISFVSCKHLPPKPVTELCVNGDAGCICNDPRLPEGEQNYMVPYDQEGCLNNISMTPESYRLYQEWADALEEIISEN